MKQLKAPNPPVVSPSAAAPPYAADNHTPFHYPQAVPQPVSSPSYTQAPPIHQSPPPFLAPSGRNDFSPSPAPMSQTATLAQIELIKLKILLLEQHHWRHSPLHEMVDERNAVMIDGERFIPTGMRSTPRIILEAQLKAQGLQKLISGNAFGYLEFRTPISLTAWQQPIPTPRTTNTQMPFAPAQPSGPAPSAIPAHSVPPTPMTDFRAPAPSAPPRFPFPISSMVNSPSIQPTPFPQSASSAEISIEDILQQHHWRKPLPEESVDYNNAILLDGEFFISIPPYASARDIIETVLLSFCGCQRLDSSGTFGYPEFKRGPHSATTPEQSVSTSSSSNLQIFFTPNRAVVASQPPISVSTSNNPAASLANPAPGLSPSSAGSSAPSLAQPPTPLVRRSLAPQPIPAAEALIIKGRLDPLIQQHWDEFSEPLQQHILYCNRGNLQSKFDLMKTAKFSDTFVSPIGWGLVREIPVRLPSSDTAENKKYYNLIELLGLHDRIDPCANTPFTLKDIRPAPEALAELKKRLPEISPHAVPRKGSR